jgi:hypothetical protein
MGTSGPSKAASRKLESKIDGLLHDLPLASGRQIAAWRAPANDLRRLLRRDYVRGLRRGLGLNEVKALLAAFEEIFPKFNSRSLGMMASKDFKRITERIGVHLKAAPYVEHDGMALRGFYVTGTPGYLKRPLIFVNTAHHQLAAETTFIHELGHHVAAQHLNLAPGQVHYFFDAEYSRHLSDRAELAADVMVSFAGYPEGVARRIFSTPWDWGFVARAANLTEAEVRRHLKKSYRFDLVRIPEDRRLHYLTGMIHYAKLRWALLTEYGV